MNNKLLSKIQQHTDVSHNVSWSTVISNHIIETEDFYVKILIFRKCAKWVRNDRDELICESSFHVPVEELHQWSWCKPITALHLRTHRGSWTPPLEITWLRQLKKGGIPRQRVGGRKLSSRVGLPYRNRPPTIFGLPDFVLKAKMPNGVMSLMLPRQWSWWESAAHRLRQKTEKTPVIRSARQGAQDNRICMSCLLSSVYCVASSCMTERRPCWG